MSRHGVRPRSLPGRWSSEDTPLWPCQRTYSTAQNIKGPQSPGESKSYADLFEDAVAQKAKHLGMDQDKFEHELRNGNTNLLSYVLATTPAAYAAYRQWVQSPGSAPPSSDRTQPSADAL